ncbi:MAG: metal-dependent hydrolase [Flavobacteriales bacterium]|jgi:kynurenine formamidase|nr:metal-dependent hydrolase [Flavobacteriales bacterium]
MMKTTVEFNGISYEIDLNKPYADLSMAVTETARAWYIDAPKFSPVILGDWKGSIELGGNMNFFSIDFNPHAHCTHTETAGHISKTRHSINQYFKEPFTLALVLYPEVTNGKVSLDRFMKAWLEAKEYGGTNGIQSVILKTDCGDANLQRNYSHSNWPYLDAEIGNFLRNEGIDHIIIDQPSVDQEEDGGALACHRTFWGATPESSLNRTITELAHIPDYVQPGNYLLNLQVAPIENDAAPSRPLLYNLSSTK